MYALPHVNYNFGAHYGLWVNEMMVATYIHYHHGHDLFLIQIEGL
jgi:hypothetical protein